jgi:hypothetical protein
VDPHDEDSNPTTAQQAFATGHEGRTEPNVLLDAVIPEGGVQLPCEAGDQIDQNIPFPFADRSHAAGIVPLLSRRDARDFCAARRSGAPNIAGITS